MYRYIGNKTKLLPFIINKIKEINKGVTVIEISFEKLSFTFNIGWRKDWRFIGFISDWGFGKEYGLHF